MGEMIRFARSDGQEVPAYYATPCSGESAHSVVVLQEWWGLNNQIKSVADRVAGLGYRALVPDLYRGKSAEKPDEAMHLMTGLDWAAACAHDVRGALAHLKRGGKKAAVMGFCMGGALTIMACATLGEADAGVCFYGMPPAEAPSPAAIRVPLLAHFAQQDDWCTPAAVDRLESELKAGAVRYEMHRYDAKHAFFNQTRSEVYDAKAADLAWSRTVAFLEKHLR